MAWAFQKKGGLVQVVLSPQEVARLIAAAHNVKHQAALSVPQQLGVDQQTVHRRLVREGTTFSEVVNTVRRELAAHYLEDGKGPLSQVGP